MLDLGVTGLYIGSGLYSFSVIIRQVLGLAVIGRLAREVVLILVLMLVNDGLILCFSGITDALVGWEQGAGLG